MERETLKETRTAKGALRLSRWNGELTSYSVDFEFGGKWVAVGHAETEGEARKVFRSFRG